jgi:hypothetical protein
MMLKTKCEHSENFEETEGVIRIHNVIFALSILTMSSAPFIK